MNTTDVGITSRKTSCLTFQRNIITVEHKASFMPQTLESYILAGTGVSLEYTIPFPQVTQESIGLASRITIVCPVIRKHSAISNFELSYPLDTTKAGPVAVQSNSTQSST